MGQTFVHRCCRAIWLALAVGVPGSLCADDPPQVATRVSSALTHECQCGAAHCRCGRWLLQESENFRVYSAPELQSALRLPAICERLRTQLGETWLGSGSDPWTPKCVVVVHRSVREYTLKLGPGSQSSSGCASLEVEQGKIVLRRIDLRSDADDWLTAALPHELTHVIVADRFSGRQPPRWADEGIAILAEPEAKQQRRWQAFREAASRGASFTARDLMAQSSYPQAAGRDAFLWQSAALVSQLVEQETPERFLDFVEAAMKTDGERALQQVYGLRIGTLDARLKSRGATPEASQISLAQRIRKIVAAAEAE
ncbi:MAG: peptidase MA family metallohydrolase [Planctomycetaceae bacterium]